MDTVGEEEPEPIKLKSLKNNRVFTVPQNDRVGKEKQRQLAAAFNKPCKVLLVHAYFNECDDECNASAVSSGSLGIRAVVPLNIHVPL